MKTYYFHNGQAQEGPFTACELQAKNPFPDTPIWYEGLSDWTTFANVPELQSISTPPPFRQSTPNTFSSPPPINTAIYEREERKKRPLIVPMTIIGVVLCLGLVGVFLVRNTAQGQELAQLHQVQDSLTTKQGEQEQQRIAEEERRRQVNEELTKKNMEYRNNWANYISIGNIHPSIDRFWGGVDAFEVPVVNNTDYMLDEVQVSVNYIKDNGGLYKTEAVSIFNIAAHSQKSGTAPSSPRGTSVGYEITNIISKKMHFCYPINNGNSEDPYFCK